MTAYIWVGGTSADWANASNWSPNTGYPGQSSSNDTVTINAGASTYPNISGDSGSGFTFAQLTIASGAGLTITAGANNAKTLTVSGVGPGYDVSNAGTITLVGYQDSSVLHAASLIVSGPNGLSNSGIITGSTASALSGGVHGIANTGAINVTSGTMTVTSELTDTGSSTINVSAGATLTTNASLTNTSGAITINGTLTATGSGPISNAGTISLAGALNSTGAGGVSNSGTINVSTLGALNGGLGGTTNKGAIDVGGTLTVTGALTNNAIGANISVYAGATLSTSDALTNTSGAINIDGALTETGSAAISNAGTITLSGGALSSTGSGGLANSGTIASSGASTLDFGAANAIANSGKLNVTGGTLTITGLITDTGSSQINISAGAVLATAQPITNTAGVITLSGGALDAGGMTNAGTITSSGVSTLDVGATNAIANSGNLDVTGGTLTVTGLITDTGSSQINISAGAVLTTAQLITNTAGVITLSGGTLTNTGADGLANAGTITSSGVSTLDVGAANTIANNGSFNVTAGTLTVNGLVANSGTIGLSGGTFAASGAITNTGSINLSGGTLTDPAGIANSATISGFGTLGAAVTGASGVISATGGTLNVNGAVTGGALTIGSGAADNLVVGADSAVSAVTYASATGSGTLTINATQTLTDSAALSVGTNSLAINGALADAAGVIVAGGTIGGSGGVSSDTSISGFGTVGINVVGGTITATSGTITLTGLVDQTGAAASLVVAGGSALNLTNSSAVGAAASPTLQFLSSSGAFMDIAATAGTVNLGAITGFAGADEIVLASYSGDAGDTYSVNGNVLTITHGSSSESFNFTPGTSMADIVVTDNGATDTITICFMPGTGIATPNGEIAIETLKPGDLVLTADGDARPVRWLGRQSVSTLFADPVRVLPIRVKAGALGEQVPHRDLLVSPDHALLVDGVMIHAGALVNGSSIVRETDVPRTFIYFHVELDDHSLILAENVPAETFVDNVDRMNFDNWAEHEALYPAGKSVSEMSRPRAKSHRQVPGSIRAALATRAEIIGAAERAVA